MSVPKSRNPSKPEPRLSNLAIDRAEAAAEQWRRYRASRRESLEAYIAAGAALAEGLAEVRHGGKSAFYKRAGIPPDTAERMLILARAGVSVDAVLEAGGIRAMTERLRRKREPEIPHGADFGAGPAGDDAPAVGAGDGPENPHGADFGSGPAGDGGGGTATVAVFSGSDPVSENAGARSGIPIGPAQRHKRKRDARRAAGRCADCGADSGDAYRCPACVSKRAAASGRAASRRRIGRALEGQIRQAAARGKGVRLTADDVRALVDGEGEAFRARLAKGGPGLARGRGRGG